MLWLNCEEVPIKRQSLCGRFDHVAARDTDDLRAFVVDHLNADADVAGTQTSLIFEHLRGVGGVLGQKLDSAQAVGG